MQLSLKLLDIKFDGKNEKKIYIYIYLLLRLKLQMINELKVLGS